jgi:hypothetical protein
VGTIADGTRIFVDIGSVSTKGVHMKAWLRWEYEKDQVVEARPNNKRYRSSKELNYFNCQERTSAIVQAVYYPDPLGKGPVVASASIEPAQATFTDVVPGSVNASILAFTCRMRR